MSGPDENLNLVYFQADQFIESGRGESLERIGARTLLMALWFRDAALPLTDFEVYEKLWIENPAERDMIASVLADEYTKIGPARHPKFAQEQGADDA